MALRRILKTFVLSTLVVAGCDCDSISRLTIVDPEDGATLGVDADDTMSGFQYDVVVRVDVLDPGETLRVYTDASVLDTDPNAPTPYTVIVGEDKSATLRVTLTPGTNPLVACARDACGMRSPTVRVTVEAGECPNIAFTNPPVGTDPSIHLGPSDDQDGSACGAEFAAAIRVNADVPNGTTLNLLVNEVAAASADAAEGVVDFGNVVLGNRGDTPNSLTVQVADSSGCSAVIGKPVFVDCDGASCAITAPAPSSMFLNASNDADPGMAGLQLDVTVTSDEDTADETTRLIIDADDANALTTTAVASGTVATSNFNDVALSEGVHAVQAECEDVAGNITRSSVAMWTVDTVACAVALTSPTVGQDIGVNDDLDLGTAGIQINAVGTATGTDCTDVRAAPCTAIAGATFDTLTANAFSESVTLGSAPSQDVCAEVRDVAGNIASAQVQVDVSTDAPALTVLTPVANTAFNRLGNPVGSTTHVADLANGTPACDVAFTVDCEGVGEPVDIVRGASVLGTATCVANGTTAFGGLATFTSIALPTDATSFTVFAQQTVGGSTGVSSAISLTGDCSAPTLTISAPACGSVFDGSDDTNTGLAGFQVPVTVTSSDSTPMPVNLVVRSAVGMQLSDNITLSTPTGNDYVFSSVTFGFAALFDVVATTFDAFGNGAQSAACQMTANDLPTLAVSVPTSNFVVNAANAAASDCDVGTGGLQLQVTASTNATNGSDATIQIGTATAFVTTVMAGSISGCVDAPQGAVNVVVDVDDTTTGDGVSGTAQISVPIVVDTLTPTATFAPTVTILNHRIATVQLDFIAQDDGGIAFASYDLRCAGAAITTELAWSAATPVALGSPPPPPLDGGQAELFVLGEMANRIFRTGVRYHCVLRAADIGGNLTPIPASNTEIFPQFQQTLVDSGSAAGMQMGYAGARPLGDVNGDGRPDVLVTGRGAAFLYFGSASPAATDSPDVVFTGSATSFGVYATGIGRFDGDDIDDFAISAYSENSNRGAVFVFRGRTVWPTTFAIDGTGCDADLCLRGNAAEEYLGYELATVGDFDADGDDDLGIGRSGVNEFVILSGRSLASADNLTLTDNPDGFRIQGVPTNPGAVDFGWGGIGMGDIIGTPATDVVVLAVGADATSFMFSFNPKLYRVAGRARLVSGMTNITGGDIVEILTGTALPLGMGQFGDRTSLASVDFNGDGELDIAVREPATTARGVRVFYNDGTGGFASASSSEIVAATGAVGDFFGATSASAYHPRADTGDVDGDGFHDLLSAALEAGSSVQNSAGLVYGRTAPAPLIDWANSTNAAVLAPLPLPVAQALPIALRMVGYAGDIDSDGFGDVIVCDFRSDGASPNGRIFVLH